MSANVQHTVPDEFVFGTQYYRPPTPTRAEWESDLRGIRDAGFNTVKIWMMWRWHERGKGAFTWDDSDRIFALCRELGLKINVNLILDAAPDWLYREYDCRRVNHKGERVRPISLSSVYIGGVAPCFDDPRVRAEAERFLRAAVGRYRRDEALLGWDVWNEPRYLTVSNIAARDGGNMECWCEYSLASYRNWLRARYGTVEALNDFLGKAWSDWDTVFPPARYDDHTEALVWRQWCAHSVSDQIGWAYGVVKETDPEKAAFCHAGGCAMVQGAGADPSDDCANARMVDFYGSSLPCDDNPWSAAIICDWIRGVSPYFWINEIYASPPGWGPGLTADDLSRVTWTALAHGAKGILYWQYKAERLGGESNGYGMVRVDGSITDRQEAAARIARFVNENRELMRALRPVPAQVGIVYDMKTDMLSHIESIYEYPYRYKRGINGAYAMFWRNNIPVDWISTRGIAAEELLRYRLVYLPSPHIVDARAAEALRGYVREGGTLISEASPGLRDERGWVSARVPNDALAELFGCRETGRLERDRRETLAISIGGRRAELESGRVTSQIEPTTARRIGVWRSGGCGASLNRYGKGEAILVGTDMGEAYHSFKGKGLLEFIRLLHDRAGCEQPARLAGARGTVSARCLQCDRADLLVVINHGPADETIRLRPGGRFLRAGQWRTAFGEADPRQAADSSLRMRVKARAVACLTRLR